jgi:hypothetical protein
MKRPYGDARNVAAHPSSRRLTEAQRGLAAGPGLVAVEVGMDVGGHVLVGHQTRDQAVHLDAVGAPFDGEGLDQVLHPGLGGRGVHEAGAAGPGVAGPDVDDRPRRARREVTATELSAAHEGAVEGDVDHGAPGVGRHVLGRDREVGRSVVDQHSRQAEGGDGGVERCAHRLGVADVAADVSAPGRRSPRDGLGGGGEVLGLAAGDDHRLPAGRTRTRSRLAQAGAAAGDEHGRCRRRCPGKRRVADSGRCGAGRSVRSSEVLRGRPGSGSAAAVAGLAASARRRATRPCRRCG